MTNINSIKPVLKLKSKASVAPAPVKPAQKPPTPSQAKPERKAPSPEQLAKRLAKQEAKRRRKNLRKNPFVNPVLQQLQERWPELFPATDDEVKRAWAIGIKKQVATSLPCSNSRAGNALTLWRNQHTKAYLAVLAKGGYRYGLDGSPSGEISAEHQQNAKTLLTQ